MDGFDSREGVIVLAATNRADVLDPALLRPGRFDRRVLVQRPDRAGRAAILKVHTKHVPLAADVDLERLAAETPGLVGAELRNLVNEAALLAARKDQSEVHARDFSEALEKITLGPARHILLNPADRERTAYHESGHALLGLLVPGSDPVHRVTIVPRGMALGATYQLPTDDRTNYPEDYLRARIISALGGRAAEQLIYGVVTTGGENDLQQVTEIARQMVLRWGMSEKLGPISFVAPQDDGLPPAFQRQPYSEATAELIDAEVRRIVEECQARSDPPARRAPRPAGRARHRAAQGRVARRARDPGSHRPRLGPRRAPPGRELVTRATHGSLGGFARPYIGPWYTSMKRSAGSGATPRLAARSVRTQMTTGPAAARAFASADSTSARLSA